MTRSLDELETPAALVDLDRMHANLARMSAYVREHGLRWRPHVKTHKVPALAAAQLAAGAHGLTVATIGEAEVMADVGSDLLLAYPPIGEPKLRRLMSLSSATRLTVGLDSAEALRGLDGAAAAAGRSVGVLVEVDLGMHRVGVQAPEQTVALAAEVLRSAALEYRGMMFYPGHIRSSPGSQSQDLRRASELLARHLDALRRAGLEPEVVSGGSTPTLWRSHEIVGMTEIRPGTNIFNDRGTVALGASGWDECAYSVLATVVSTAAPGQVVVDAGAKALAKDDPPLEGKGYGALLDRPEISVRALSEEHGILDLSGTDWRPRIGDRVRIIPNHVCVSVNLQERLYGVRGGQVVDEWEVSGRRRLPAPQR
ncbi:MAG: D-TA family PLP-dependent enzyme [Gemmatimonadetes bacterium]|nr:D-TA family PLP-dependent enzyme [Gemmatimonadota bacterium]